MRILVIRLEQKTRNEEVRRRVRCRKNTKQQLKGRKLNLFGHIHVCRMKDESLVKVMLE